MLSGFRTLWAEPAEEERRAPAPPLSLAAVFLILFAAIALRRVEAIARPQLYAEEGRVFLQDELSRGFLGSVARPYMGYVHVVPRAVMAIACAGRTAWIPLLSSLLTIAIGALCCAWLSRREFRRVIPGDGARLAVCAWLAAAPVGTEVAGCLANVQWYLLWLGLLLALAPMPAGPRAIWRAGHVAAAWLVELSAGCSFVLAPLWLARAVLRRRDRGEALAAALCLAPIAAQLVLGYLALGTAPASESGGSPGGVEGALRLLARFLVGPLFGDFDPLRLFWALGIPAALFLAVCVLVPAVVVALSRGGPAVRAFLLAGAMLSAGIFVSVCLSRPSTLTYGWSLSNRYVFLPGALIVALVAAASSHGPPAERRLLLPAIVLLAAVAAAAYRLPARPDIDWPAHAAEIDRAIAERRTERVEFDINPQGWDVRLHFIEGRAIPPEEESPSGG